jgi:hypothetical protein
LFTQTSYKGNILFAEWSELCKKPPMYTTLMLFKRLKAQIRDMLQDLMALLVLRGFHRSHS